jgi:hypothetical protein
MLLLKPDTDQPTPLSPQQGKTHFPASNNLLDEVLYTKPALW